MLTNLCFADSTSGFTLLELLATLLILCLLVSVAIPTQQTFLRSHRSLSKMNQIAHALYIARSEAIKRNEKMILCASSDKKNCGKNWQDGQILVTSTGQLLRIFPSLPQGDRLIWNSSLGKDESVEWLPDGYTNGQRGTFYYCADQSANSRSLVLLNTGRWYIASLDETNFKQFCGL